MSTRTINFLTLLVLLVGTALIAMAARVAWHRLTDDTPISEMKQQTKQLEQINRELDRQTEQQKRIADALEKIEKERK